MVVGSRSRHAHKRGIDINVHFHGQHRFLLGVDLLLQQLVEVVHLFTVLMSGRHCFKQRLQPAGGQLAVNVPVTFS